MSKVTDVELSYVSGLSSKLQTQLGGLQVNTIGGASSITSPKLRINRALLCDANGKVAVPSVINTERGYLSSVASAIQTPCTRNQNAVTGGATTRLTTDLTINSALLSDANGKVAGSSVANTELGYLRGVTGAIQAQFTRKQNTVAGGATTRLTTNLTLNMSSLSDGSGKVAVSSVTNAELGYSSGVTRAIQRPLNGKQATITSGASSVASSNLNGGKVCNSQVRGQISTCSLSSGILTYLTPITRDVQHQINPITTQVNPYNTCLNLTSGPNRILYLPTVASNAGIAIQSDELSKACV